MHPAAWGFLERPGNSCGLLKLSEASCNHLRRGFLELPGASWSFLELPGASWSFLTHSEAFWSFLGPSEASWSFLELPGAFWSLLPLGASWGFLGLHVASWGILRLPGATKASIHAIHLSYPSTIPEVCGLQQLPSNCWDLHLICGHDNTRPTSRTGSPAGCKACSESLRIRPRTPPGDGPIFRAIFGS